MTIATKGALLMEAMIAIALLFLTVITVLYMMSTNDRAYAQAIQTRVALRLARESLESVRAGTIPPAPGVQKLTAVSLREGSVAMAFSPEIESLLQGKIWLVRSRVLWSEGPRNHVVELKTFVGQ